MLRVECALFSYSVTLDCHRNKGRIFRCLPLVPRSSSRRSPSQLSRTDQRRGGSSRETCHDNVFHCTHGQHETKAICHFRQACDSSQDVNFMTSPENKKNKTFPLVCAATQKYRNTPQGKIDFRQVLPCLVTDMRPLKISPLPAMDCFRTASPVRAHSNRG